MKHLWRCSRGIKAKVPDSGLEINGDTCFKTNEKKDYVVLETSLFKLDPSEIYNYFFDEDYPKSIFTYH